MEDLRIIIKRYSRKIRECTGNSRFIYGDIYGDIVFGALLSGVSNMGKRRILMDKAFEDYISEDNAMCAALGRQDAVENAAKLADEKGIAQAVFELFPIEYDSELFENISNITALFLDEINGD